MGTRERPILFSGAMVRAILDGKKTQTRRRVRSPIGDDFGDIDRFDFDGKDGTWVPTIRMRDGDEAVAPRVRCPYGKAGDRLWVRETFGPKPEYPDALTLPEYEGGENPERVIYRADEARDLIEHCGIVWERIRWRTSIHMPRWASRITLEITDVRLQRLHEITEEDARAEGCTARTYRDGRGHEPAVVDFRRLWDSINGKRYPWSSNPWVWAITFRKLEAT